MTMSRAQNDNERLTPGYDAFHYIQNNAGGELYEQDIIADNHPVIIATAPGQGAGQIIR